MSKKSYLTQDMVNVYPENARVRMDQDSNGFRILNSFAKSLEDLKKQMFLARENAYLYQANLKEMANIYKVDLAIDSLGELTDFAFEVSTDDIFQDTNTEPVVKGTPDGGSEITLALAENNDIQSFWSTSVPTRFSVGAAEALDGHNLLTLDPGIVLDEDEHVHPHGYGKILFNVECPSALVQTDMNTNRMTIVEVLVEGITRQGLESHENLLFLWPGTQQSIKEWQKITRVEIKRAPVDLTLNMYSSDFAMEEYLDLWNFEHSRVRKEIDTFLSLTQETIGVTDISVLNYSQFATEELEQIALGFNDKSVRGAYRLLDSDYADAIYDDIAQERFTDDLYAVTASGVLSIYDRHELISDNHFALKDAVPGTPQPGVLISINIPTIMTIIKIDVIIGLLMNRIKLSPQLTSSSIILPSAFPENSSTSERLTRIVSAIPYSTASLEVRVMSCVLSTSPSISTRSSTIPSAMSVLRPVRSAVERISERI